LWLALATVFAGLFSLYESFKATTSVIHENIDFPHDSEDHASLEAAVPYSVAFLTELWKNAQLIAGLPDTTADHPEKVFQWHSIPGAGHQGSIVVGYNSTAYVRIFKGGSEMIEANLRAASSLSRAFPASNAFRNDSRCWWTFVREPIGRFVSAYTEMEYRYEIGLRSRKPDRDGNSVDPAEMKDWAFTNETLGSKERASAFIKDVLSMRWSIRVNNAGRPASIFYNGAFAHIPPMSSTTWAYKFDFVGRLERENGVMETDWSCMNSVCGTDIGFDGHLGQHLTSKDPYGTKNAMEQVIVENQNLRCALYMMMWPDFHNFDYPPPDGCGAISDPSASISEAVSTADPWTTPLGKQCGKSTDPVLLRKQPVRGAFTKAARYGQQLANQSIASRKHR
jgi:hypothetical protein